MAEQTTESFGLVLVCFVPDAEDPSTGRLAVPLSGTCDIAWHQHLLGSSRHFDASMPEGTDG